MSDENRGIPLVSHRLFDDTFVVHEASSRSVVLSRKDASEVVRQLGEMLSRDPSPTKAGQGGVAVVSSPYDDQNLA